MIKKIQQYLLVHHPLLWNIRLVPMILILIGFHLLLFAISFFSSEIPFSDTYYYSYSFINSNGTMYTATIFIGILILIGWLLYYMRNNAVKTFYPRTTFNLFAEWFLVFAVCLMITSLPVSLSTGTIVRWQMVASKKQTQQNLDLLEKVKVIIPSDLSDYQFRANVSKPLPIADSVKINPHDIDLDLYSFDYTLEGKIAIKGYKGPSLLFYNDYDTYDYEYYMTADSTYASSEAGRKINNINIVKGWLRNGQQDSIYALMADFFKLADKHNLKTNITPEEWMKQIYNPPYFNVNYLNRISEYLPSSNYRDYYSDNSDNYYRGYDDDRDLYYVSSYYGDTLKVGTKTDIDIFYQTISNYSLPLRELESGYKQVAKSYDSNEDLCNITLVCFCVATMLSVFIFSCRMTSGRSWLAAIVITGVLFFAITLFVYILSQAGGYRDSLWAFVYVLFWIALFFSLFGYLLTKNKNNKEKGHSRPLVNIMLWIVPCIIPLLYTLIILFYEDVLGNYYSPWKEEVTTMFWLNIPIVIISMLGITKLLRKWKSLPED